MEFYFKRSFIPLYIKQNLEERQEFSVLCDTTPGWKSAVNNQIQNEGITMSGLHNLATCWSLSERVIWIKAVILSNLKNSNGMYDYIRFSYFNINILIGKKNHTKCNFSMNKKISKLGFTQA